MAKGDSGRTEKPDETTDTGKEKSGRVEHSSTERTARGSGGRGTGGRSGSGGSPSTNETPRLVTVNDPNKKEAGDKTDDKPKRGRGRPKGSTTKNKTSNSGSKSNGSSKSNSKKKQDKNEQFDINNLKAIMKTGSEIVSSRPGMEVWALTEKEIDQLCEPLGRMIERSEALSKMSEGNADAMALMVACFTIFTPKFLMWNATRPKKAKEGEKVNYGTDTRTSKQRDKQKGTSGSDAKRNDGQHDRPTTSTHTNDGVQRPSSVIQSIPAIGGI